MNMEFFRKLPIPKEVKEEFPVTPELERVRSEQLTELKKIFTGGSDKFALIIGPCSADNEDSVLDYVTRLRRVADKVSEKIVIVPRVYTNKPRTTGMGYMGMLHQPNPNEKPDLLRGIVAIRKLLLRVLSEAGFGCADEMLYPENHRYLSDLLSYVAVGARSVEDQQHRLTASGLDIPVGMKNPTSGDITVMMNSIRAAQSSHVFLYRGWEVKSVGNPTAHAILRGYVGRDGVTHPNYRYDDLYATYLAYKEYGLKNPTVIVDTNHANSGKDHIAQIGIAKDVLKSRKRSRDIADTVKGLMIESYIEDGAQAISDNCIYGKSLTDPCLGWEKTEKLIYDIADLL